MENSTLLGVVGVVGVLLVAWAFVGVARFRRATRERRRKFIASYAFPSELRRRLNAAHPDWSFTQVDLVLTGLRDFFRACLEARSPQGFVRQLGMPSRAVDEAWHEFILMTRDYAGFCEKAFGRYLHHTPDAQMQSSMEDALARTLHFSRRATGPAVVLPGAAALATGVPLLFLIDHQLGLANGYRYDDAALERLEHHRQALLGRADGGGGDAVGDGGSGHGHAHADGGGAASCGAASCGGGGGGGCSGGGGCGGS